MIILKPNISEFLTRTIPNFLLYRCLNVEDEEIRKRREAMFIKCGEDLSVLRKDKEVSE